MRLRAGESHGRYAGRCSTRCRGAEDTEPRVARPEEVLEEIEANASLADTPPERALGHDRLAHVPRSQSGPGAPAHDGAHVQ